MKIKEVTFGRTISKNYQSSRAEVTLELEDGDTFERSMMKAKMLVASALGEAPTKEQIEKARELAQWADGK